MIVEFQSQTCDGGPKRPPKVRVEVEGKNKCFRNECINFTEFCKGSSWKDALLFESDESDQVANLYLFPLPKEKTLLRVSVCSFSV